MGDAEKRPGFAKQYVFDAANGRLFIDVPSIIGDIVTGSCNG